MKLGLTITQLNNYLTKNHKKLKLKRGLICGFTNDLMAFEGRGQIAKARSKRRAKK